MARNTAKGRVGPVRNRFQWFNARIGRWVKCDAKGRILGVKADLLPWKGVRKVKGPLIEPTNEEAPAQP